MALFNMHAFPRSKPAVQSSGNFYVELASVDTSEQQPAMNTAPVSSQRVYRNKRFSLSSGAFPLGNKDYAGALKTSTIINTTAIVEETQHKATTRDGLPPFVSAQRRMTLGSQRPATSGSPRGDWGDLLRSRSDFAASLRRPPTAAATLETIEIVEEPETQAERADVPDSFVASCIHDELSERPDLPRSQTFGGHAHPATDAEAHYRLDGHKRRPSNRIGGAVQGLGQKVKRRLSSMTHTILRKDSALSSPVQHHAEQKANWAHAAGPPRMAGLEVADLAQRGSSISGWSMTEQERSQQTHSSAPYDPRRLASDADDLDTQILREDAEPLLGPRPLASVVDNGFGQAVSRRRRTTAPLPVSKYQPHHVRQNHTSGLDSRASGTLAVTTEETDEELSRMLTRITSAIEEANAQGAFSEEVISARFDSAYGSGSDSEEPSGLTKWKRQLSEAGLAKSTKTPERERPQLRKADTAPPVTNRNNTGGTASKRQSIWGIVSRRDSHSTSGTSSPTGKRDRMDFSAVASVAGRSLQRGSIMLG